MMDTGEQTFMGKPASVIRFNQLTGQLEKPVILLKTRNGNTLGKLQYTNLNLSFVAKGLDNLSFDVHKTVNGKECECWDKLIDLCIIDYVGYGQFECHVSVDDATETVKTCVCESLETELGQHVIRNMHINDEDAITYNDPFIPTVLYNKEDPSHSLLHRVLAEKTPHWEVGYVSPIFAINGMVYDASQLQRTFTIDEKTPYDFFDEDVSSAFSCVFTYDTYQRKVNCYNLEDCVYDRNTHEILDGCYYLNDNYYDASDQIITDSSHLAHCDGIGEDTTIFLSKNKLANSFSLDSDAGSIKNCFYVTGGDDVITNTVAAANATGNNYIYLFGNFQYDDMSKGLVDAIKKYSGELESAKKAFTQPGGVYIRNDEDYVLDPLAYYKDETMYDRNDNPLTNDEAVYEKPGLYTEYTNMLDRINYWEHNRFPDVELSDTTAEEQKGKIEKHFITDGNPVYIQSACRSDIFSHVTANIESILGVICDSRYSVDVLKDNTHTITCDAIDKDHTNGYWNGYVSLTRDYKPTDTVCFSLKIPLRFVSNTEESIAFCKQKMDIAIAKMDIKELDFTELSNNALHALISQFNLASVKAFRDGFASCRSMLDDLYSNMELEESQIPASEAMLLSRERYNQRYEIANSIYESMFAKIEKLNGEKDILNEKIKTFRENLDIKTHLGEKLWKEFRSYVREDTYNNSNYISDGLTNAELLAKAKELLDAANNELKKACTIQYSVSSDLNNIFTLQEKEILHDKFAMFNYVRVRIDDSIYKLRLMDISFSEESPEKLDVTFSRQIVDVSGKASDKQKILEQSQSIATTYSSTATQAKQGAKALNQFNVLKQEGLDSSLYLIKNSTTEEVTFGNTGLSCKSMLDQGIYSPYQLQLTHNGLYLTDDGFHAIKTAIGRFKYNHEWVYGVNTDVIMGNLIVGKNLLIQNQNENGETSVSIDGDGIDITNGSIALSGSNYSIEIDPNHNNKNTLNNYLLCVRNKHNDDDILMSVNTDGDAYFKGELETANGKIGNWTIGDAIYYETNSATSTVTGTYIGTDAIRQYNAANGKYVHIQDGKLTCNDAEISGAIVGGRININNKFIVDENGNVTLPAGTKISWDDVINANNIVTSITENTISTTNLLANNLRVNSVNIVGQLTASQINTTGLIAENISGTTIEGKSIIGSTINGSNVTATFISALKEYYIHHELYPDTNFKIINVIKTDALNDTKIQFGILSDPTNPYLDSNRITFHSVATEREINVYTNNFSVNCNMNVKGNIESTESIICGDIFPNNVHVSGDLGLYNDTIGNYLVHRYSTATSEPKATHNRFGNKNIPSAIIGGSNVYSNHAITTVSDERIKKDIDGLEKYEKWYMDIKPISFKFVNGESGRTHIGASAQNIKHSLFKNNLTTTDFAGYVEMPTDPDVLDYIEDNTMAVLRYEEFIMLNTHMIQKAYKKLEQQQEQINQQQSEIASLKETISSFMQNN